MAPLTLAVKSITSVDDSTELGADEPYILVTAIDLSSALPQVEVTKYGPWSDVDKGETHSTLIIPPNAPQSVIDMLSQYYVLRLPFWGLDNKTPAPVDPNRVFFIVSVMENDDGKPAALRTIVKSAAIGSLAASVGMPMSTRIQKVIADINGALGVPTGAPNFDDIVGTRQLVLSAADLTPPGSGKSVKTLKFPGGDEGTFDVAIELSFS